MICCMAQSYLHQEKAGLAKPAVPEGVVRRYLPPGCHHRHCRVQMQADRAGSKAAVVHKVNDLVAHSSPTPEEGQHVRAVHY